MLLYVDSSGVLENTSSLLFVFILFIFIYSVCLACSFFLLLLKLC